ncbi:MAG: DHH family phosphoesterase, partial [Solirubrobacterales bacterium]|nr:DHH family phosphoesterase [Solirubrobacterales bacterium]
MSVAVETALAAVAEGQRITIYGDFDCDGVCATSILVGAFRGLGGECDWFIPDRISEGYGLNPEAIREIASRGTSLVVTVDCGVTAVDEVALARNLGMEIVVTDHHQPDDDL